MSKQAAVAGHQSRCPICGLPLKVRARESLPLLEYDFPAWNERCHFPALGGPSMCLAKSFEPEAAIAEAMAGAGDDVAPVRPGGKARF